ncbi:MAG TPA: hypothetical protein VNX15_09830 [Gemmatimonadales bacterium]|jgi:hypothetical protein|nr:hypothetical protein [Gemmatimonadales bacterium]
MRHIALAGALALAPVPLLAQWGVGVSLGVARYYGGAVSAVDSTPGAVHPYRPTTVTLAVGRDWGALRVDWGISYGAPGIAAEIDGGAFVDTKAAHFVAGAPEVTVRVLRVGADGALRVGGGADITLWSLTDFESRVLVGGHVTAMYEWPVAGRFLGNIQAGVSLSPSLFRETEVSSSFERRMLVRPGVSVGLRYR